MCIEWEFCKRIIKENIRNNRKIIIRWIKDGRFIRFLKWLEFFIEFKKNINFNKIRKRTFKKNYSFYWIRRRKFWFYRK
jgi:hypothetical protein